MGALCQLAVFVPITGARTFSSQHQQSREANYRRHCELQMADRNALQLATRHDFSESHPLAIRSGISQFQIGERSPFSFAQCRFDFGNEHLSLGGQMSGNRIKSPRFVLL